MKKILRSKRQIYMLCSKCSTKLHCQLLLLAGFAVKRSRAILHCGQTVKQQNGGQTAKWRSSSKNDGQKFWLTAKAVTTAYMGVTKPCTVCQTCTQPGATTLHTIVCTLWKPEHGMEAWRSNLVEAFVIYNSSRMRLFLTETGLPVGTLHSEDPRNQDLGTEDMGTQISTYWSHEREMVPLL